MTNKATRAHTHRQSPSHLKFRNFAPARLNAGIARLDVIPLACPFRSSSRTTFAIPIRRRRQECLAVVVFVVIFESTFRGTDHAASLTPVSSVRIVDDLAPVPCSTHRTAMLHRCIYVQQSGSSRISAFAYLAVRILRWGHAHRRPCKPFLTLQLAVTPSELRHPCIRTSHGGTKRPPPAPPQTPS